MDYKAALDEAFEDQIGHLFQVLCINLTQGMGELTALNAYTRGAQIALHAYHTIKLRGLDDHSETD